MKINVLSGVNTVSREKRDIPIALVTYGGAPPFICDKSYGGGGDVSERSSGPEGVQQMNGQSIAEVPTLKICEKPTHSNPLNAKIYLSKRNGEKVAHALSVKGRPPEKGGGEWMH